MCVPACVYRWKHLNESALANFSQDLFVAILSTKHAGLSGLKKTHTENTSVHKFELQFHKFFFEL
jgi:hypothetical protein